MITEHWWDVPLNVKYQASSLGRIRTKHNEYIHKPAPDLDGYLTVRLSGKTYRVHRLVALTFLGEREDGLHVAHIDGDNQNNRINNLRYATSHENHLDKFRHDTVMHGSRNGNAKLNEESVAEIKQRLRNGESTVKLGREYGVNRNTVLAIKKGQIWARVS